MPRIVPVKVYNVRGWQEYYRAANKWEPCQGAGRPVPAQFVFFKEDGSERKRGYVVQGKHHVTFCLTKKEVEKTLKKEI